MKEQHVLLCCSGGQRLLQSMGCTKRIKRQLCPCLSRDKVHPTVCVSMRQQAQRLGSRCAQHARLTTGYLDSWQLSGVGGLVRWQLSGKPSPLQVRCSSASWWQGASSLRSSGVILWAWHQRCTWASMAASCSRRWLVTDRPVRGQVCRAGSSLQSAARVWQCPENPLGDPQAGHRCAWVVRGEAMILCRGSEPKAVLNIAQQNEWGPAEAAVAGIARPSHPSQETCMWVLSISICLSWQGLGVLVGSRVSRHHPAVCPEQP